MNVAKSILALSLYLARKADMELAQVTEEDNNKRSKEENEIGNDTKTERRNRTEPETGVPVPATSRRNIRRKGVRSSARECTGAKPYNTYGLT